MIIVAIKYLAVPANMKYKNLRNSSSPKESTVNVIGNITPESMDGA